MGGQVTSSEHPGAVTREVQVEGEMRTGHTFQAGHITETTPFIHHREGSLAQCSISYAVRWGGLKGSNQQVPGAVGPGLYELRSKPCSIHMARSAFTTDRSAFWSGPPVMVGGLHVPDLTAVVQILVARRKGGEVTEAAKATRCTPGKERSSQNHGAPENANRLEAALTVVLFCVLKLFLHRGPTALTHLLPDVKEGRGAAERLAPEALRPGRADS